MPGSTGGADAIDGAGSGAAAIDGAGATTGGGGGALAIEGADSGISARGARFKSGGGAPGIEAGALAVTGGIAAEAWAWGAGADGGSELSDGIRLESVGLDCGPPGTPPVTRIESPVRSSS